MNKFIAVAVFAAACVLLISGCQNADAPKVSKTPAPTATAAPKVDEHGHTDDAPRISITEAKKEFDAGTAIFVDTRAEVAWRAERIKGAISVPAEAVLQRYKDIPTGKKIIAYCT